MYQFWLTNLFICKSRFVCRRFSQKTNERTCLFFAVKSRKVKKTNSSLHFSGKSMAGQYAYGFIWPLVSRHFHRYTGLRPLFFTFVVCCFQFRSKPFLFNDIFMQLSWIYHSLWKLKPFQSRFCSTLHPVRHKPYREIKSLGWSAAFQ